MFISDLIVYTDLLGKQVTFPFLLNRNHCMDAKGRELAPVEMLIKSQKQTEPNFLIA